MSDRTAADVRRDLLLLHEKGATKIFVNIEDYELLMLEAPVRVAEPDEFTIEESLLNLVPTVYGCFVEWRMFYHGEPTDVEPTRRRPTIIATEDDTL